MEQAKELLSIYPDEVSLSLRFLISGDKGETSGLLLKTWVGSLIKQRNNGLPDGQALIEAWYEAMDVEIFGDSHPLNGVVSDKEAEEYSRAHYGWIKQAGITKTPTTFMNGYELPTAYRLKDLAALIPGLTDTFGNQNGLNTIKRNSVSIKLSEK